MRMRKKQFRMCTAGPHWSAGMYTHSSTKVLADEEPATTSKSASVAERNNMTEALHGHSRASHDREITVRSGC